MDDPWNWFFGAVAVVLVLVVLAGLYEFMMLERMLRGALRVLRQSETDTQQIQPFVVHNRHDDEDDSDPQRT